MNSAQVSVLQTPELKRRLPPLNSLKTFEACARTRNFKQAANELCVSQSAVSHQIRNLEEFLGVRLFQREGRSMALSTEAVRLLPAISGAFNQMQEACSTLMDEQGDKVLRIATYSTVGIRFLLPKFKEFEALNPDIKVHITTSQKDNELISPAVDVALIIGEPEQTLFFAKPVFSMTLFPVASPEYLKGKPVITSAEDLFSHQLLQVHSSIDDWHRWFAHFSLNNQGAEPPISLDSYDHAIKMAESGLGICLTNPLYVRKELKQGSLVPVLENVDMPVLNHWYLVCRATDQHKPSTERFFDWFLNLSKEAGLS